MDPRQLLRPLPLFFAFLFVTVAIIDLVGTLVQKPQPASPFLRPGACLLYTSDAADDNRLV